MNTLDRETIADHFKSFQAQIYEHIEGFEDNKSFIKDGWEKQIIFLMQLKRVQK